jgi:hypothetical protein
MAGGSLRGTVNHCTTETSTCCCAVAMLSSEPGVSVFEIGPGQRRAIKSRPATSRRSGTSTQHGGRICDAGKIMPVGYWPIVSGTTSLTPVPPACEDNGAVRPGACALGDGALTASHELIEMLVDPVRNNHGRPDRKPGRCAWNFWSDPAIPRRSDTSSPYSIQRCSQASRTSTHPEYFPLLPIRGPNVRAPSETSRRSCCWRLAQRPGHRSLVPGGGFRRQQGPNSASGEFL